ncbi:MAG: DUF188 domain-containing protein [Treponema sp.]|nr:DUF188 domain-containing protein [Treponema sp.]
MKIVVDADSCPRQARELALRAARRLGIQAVFAANRALADVSGPCARMEVCPNQENAADDRLAQLAMPGDLGITRDLGLAKRLLDKGCAVIDDRGRAFTKENINELLSIRTFTLSLSDNGLGQPRIAGYGKKESKAFADSLDRHLARLTRPKNDWTCSAT